MVAERHLERGAIKRWAAVCIDITLVDLTSLCLICVTIRVYYAAALMCRGWWGYWLAICDAVVGASPPYTPVLAAALP